VELIKAEALARGLMTKHGLSSRGWSFKFDNAKNRLGLCNFSTTTISVSRYMAGAANEEELTQIMLHEIAHALLADVRNNRGGRVGHGPLWKAKAKEIGYTGQRLSVNPYHTARRATTSPVYIPQPVMEAPGKLLNVGDEVRMIHSGLTGEIIKVNRTRYKIDTRNGQIWNSPFANVIKIGEGTKTPIRMTPTVTQRLKKNMAVKVVLPAGRSSKYNGLTGTIRSVGSKNYSVALATGGLLTVPHSFAVAI